MFGFKKKLRLKPDIKIDRINIMKMFLDDMVLDKDYRVDTYTVFTSNGDDYPNLGLAFLCGMTEDDIESIEDDMVKYNYAVRFNDENPDLELAKKCGFGVMTILNGNFAGQQYMFPLADSINAVSQIHAYYILKYGVVAPNFLRYVSDEKNKDTLCWYLGVVVYQMIVDKLFISQI